MIREICGVFIYAKDAAALVEWYKAHLGIQFQFDACESSYYKDFVLPIDQYYRRAEREVFAIRQAEPNASVQRRLVINLRVHDLRVLLEQKRLTGVEVDRTEGFEYGRFALLKDREGNELELFEPSELCVLEWSRSAFFPVNCS
jgi:predicted enzyme related to lactoylglutathione lyase